MNRNLVLLRNLSLGRIVRWRGLWTEEKPRIGIAGMAYR